MNKKIAVTAFFTFSDILGGFLPSFVRKKGGGVVWIMKGKGKNDVMI